MSNSILSSLCSEFVLASWFVYTLHSRIIVMYDVHMLLLLLLFSFYFDVLNLPCVHCTSNTSITANSNNAHMHSDSHSQIRKLKHLFTMFQKWVINNITEHGKCFILLCACVQAFVQTHKHTWMCAILESERNHNHLTRSLIQQTQK